MDSLSLSVVVIGYCQMGYYVFQGNVTKQISSFMPICILMTHCWGGGLAERTEFYHYCDICGLFW